LKKNRDSTDVRTLRKQLRAHKHRKSDSPRDLIEENLVAEQQLAALLRSRTPGEK
jgi:hypothetical protein